MKQKLNWAWRLIGTAIAFSTFGIGGLILPLIVVPTLYLLPGGPGAREMRAKAALHYAFRGFVEIMRGLGLLTYNVEQRELLNRPGQLILANHPSLIDVVFLIAFIKRADCVVKSSLLRNPFMIGPISVANYIANDSSEQVIELARQSLDRGNSLIVFPEGTRTTPGQPITMRRGAANIALRCNCPITPVVITCEPSTLTKDLKWYQIPERRFHVALKLQPQLPVAPYLEEQAPSLAARQLTRFLEQYFSQELCQA
ncbi:1-acyl-sn-glycerol-3-phosphate acyltransferase [Pseudomaricurvus alkylphenolicus]|jgi:1-acyl-sn-glycerol-3-phosphate acyltransferase|uniref:lysophospholipid acyltransferase family protein n=1 Tax=Pseudomaricurvus alkylphenolicus TaxID=1306991 RepID=UPI0014223F3A|nr:lysophospholipid acyltransferase family protein [Pseudomaricurvus alkylphenolicus]NIB44223.1 1-acyl-sn-glycerol-3-phosphate acyltransferase [Pseudomaricurvus alkylphenolicus]